MSASPQNKKFTIVDTVRFFHAYPISGWHALNSSFCPESRHLMELAMAFTNKRVNSRYCATLYDTVYFCLTTKVHYSDQRVTTVDGVMAMLLECMKLVQWLGALTRALRGWRDNGGGENLPKATAMAASARCTSAPASLDAPSGYYALAVAGAPATSTQRRDEPTHRVTSNGVRYALMGEARMPCVLIDDLAEKMPADYLKFYSQRGNEDMSTRRKNALAAIDIRKPTQSHMIIRESLRAGSHAAFIESLMGQTPPNAAESPDEKYLSYTQLHAFRDFLVSSRFCEVMLFSVATVLCEIKSLHEKYMQRVEETRANADTVMQLTLGGDVSGAAFHPQEF